MDWSAGDWISTYSGGRLNIFDERPEFALIDIFHGLSNTCRFAGQCNQFYSVGRHSMYLADIVRMEYGEGKKHLTRVALMHDAAEFIYGDIPTPIRRSMEDYNNQHDLLLKKIFAHYELDYSMMDFIKVWDKRLGRTEADFLGFDTSCWKDLAYRDPYPIEITNDRSPQWVREGLMGRFVHGV